MYRNRGFVKKGTDTLDVAMKSQKTLVPSYRSFERITKLVIISFFYQIRLSENCVFEQHYYFHYCLKYNVNEQGVKLHPITSFGH